MRIAVCEDEPIQAELLRDLAERWAKGRKAALSVECFPTAEAFLFRWEEFSGYDLLILDIQMPGRDGLSLAREVRSRDPRLPLLFVTGLADFVGEGYDVSALHYLVKPVEETKFFACLDRALAEKREEEVLFVTGSEGETVRLYQRELILAEALAHWVELRHTGGVLRVRRSFQDLLSDLNPALFVRCHRSYLVGLGHIASLGRTELTLDDGSKVPVSRRLLSQVSRAFVKYYHGEGEA